jgi:hypothetical protein
MNRLLPEHQFLIVLTAGVAAFSLLSGSPSWYLNFLLIALVYGILVFTRTWPDRGFYLVCSGEPLIIACSIQNLWAGLFVICMLGGVVCGAMGLLESRQDLHEFAYFCGSCLLIALLIQISNHVQTPLIIMSIIIVVILTIQSVRIYQFRKHYSGA